MSPERARELLGGLATGILTPEERQTLFEAALHDQTLFNEVADELEFGAFLQSAETRAQLANRIEVEPPRRQWWALRPRWLALSGALAASLVVFVAVWQQHRPSEVMNDAKSVIAEQAPKVAAPPAVAPEPPAPQPQPASTQPQAQARPSVAAEKPKLAEDKRAGVLKDAPAPVDLAKRREEIRADAPAPAPAPAQGVVATRAFGPVARDAAPVPPKSASVPLGNAIVAPATHSAAAASIAGTVRDQSGAPVPNTAIQIVNTATKTTTKTISDAAGHFSAAALPAGGPYTVIAQASGFKTEEKSGITLATNSPVQLDIPLQVGMVANSVEVTAAAPAIQAESAHAKPGVAGGQQIAVLNFTGGASPGQSGQQIADQLSSQLQSSGQNVIDRGAVQQAQQQAASSQVPTNKQAADLGRKLGADAVIVGSVQENSGVAIKAKVIETKKARPLANVAATGSSLQGTTNQIGLKLESKLAEPIEGTVARLDADLLAINLKSPGLARIGAHLEVFHGNQKIGELVITAANGRAASGKYTGTVQPRPGDRVASPR